MNKRIYEIKVRLAADEMAYLNQLVAASGLSRETYLRMVISGVVPKEAPPPDFWAMMRELHAIGNNLNQIAAFFNSGGLPSHVMSENINHAISCIFEMREQVAEMAGKNYGNLKAYRK